jgi:hypothetical protein
MAALPAKKVLDEIVQGPRPLQGTRPRARAVAAASLIPAFRATRVDPLVALKDE